jgi:hypothetical protein
MSDEEGNEDTEITMPSGAHLMISARYPMPGKAKTRLIPALELVGRIRKRSRQKER